MKYFIQVNLMCVLMLAGVLVTGHKKKNVVTARDLTFNQIIWITIIMCISDAIAWCTDGQVFPGSRILLEAGNIIYFISITWAGCAWLNYVDVRLRGLTADYKKRRFYRAIPLLVFTGIMLTNPITHVMFTVDENNVYERGPLVFLHWIFSFGYLIVAAVRSVLMIVKAKSKMERDQYIPLLWFIILPLASSVIQILFYGVTAVSCGITLSIIMVSYESIKAQISSDTLTGLNNRRALENYFGEQLQHPDRQITVLMCDIDKFKSINDTLGHAQGDIALKRAAASLKRACGKHPKSAFLCRYGGDEFVICGVDTRADEMEPLARNIREELAKSNAEHPDEPQLEISIGIADGLCEGERDAETLLRAADMAMYRQKKEKSAARS